MAKTKQKLRKYNKQNLTILAIAVLVVVIALFYVYKRTIERYNFAADFAEVTSIREPVLKASDSMHKDAVVDAKTGGIYFPPTRLYLPKIKDTFQRLAYGITELDNGKQEINISDRVINGIIQGKMYSARDINSFFDQIPHLQSCARGVTVSYTKLTKDESPGKLKKTVQLTNGEKLYLYTEDKCPELNSTVATLSNLRVF